MGAEIREHGDKAGLKVPLPVPDVTLPEYVLAHARQRGNRRALVDAATGAELTYAELATAVDEVSAGLAARGVVPGDVLALCAPNGELEGLLLTHPAVADAAIVRHLDEAAGEVPTAYVLLSDALSGQDLMNWVAERVAPYKRVRLVEFTDTIPKSPSGKILRRLLIAQEAGAGQAVPGRQP